MRSSRPGGRGKSSLNSEIGLGPRSTRRAREEIVCFPREAWRHGSQFIPLSPLNKSYKQNKAGRPGQVGLHSPNRKLSATSAHYYATRSVRIRTLRIGRIDSISPDVSDADNEYVIPTTEILLPSRQYITVLYDDALKHNH